MSNEPAPLSQPPEDPSIWRGEIDPEPTWLKDWRPMGTPEEMRASGLDLREYGSCAVPDQRGGVEGCPHFNYCHWSWKSKTGQTPETVTYQVLKSKQNGGGAREGEAPCYVALQLWRMATAAKNKFVILGGANTLYQIRGTKLDPALKPGDPGYGVQQPFSLRVRSKSHPRVSDNPLLTDEIAKAAIWRSNAERENEEAIRQHSLTGLPDEPMLSDGTPPESEAARVRGKRG